MGQLTTGPSEATQDGFAGASHTGTAKPNQPIPSPHRTERWITLALGAFLALFMTYRAAVTPDSLPWLAALIALLVVLPVATDSRDGFFVRLLRTVSILFITLLLAVAIAATWNRVFKPSIVQPIFTKAPYFAANFFRDDSETFFSDIQNQWADLKSHDVTLKKDLYVHFISADYQLGVHAFVGIDSRTGTGRIPVRVVPASGNPDASVIVVSWGGQSKPQIIAAATQNENMVGYIPIPRDSKTKSCAIFRYYPDKYEGSSDYFILPTSAFYDPKVAAANQTIVEHIVVMRRSDISRWNPSQFSFYIQADGPSKGKLMRHSGLSYISIDPKSLSETGECGDAHEALKMVLQAVTDARPETFPDQSEWFPDFKMKFPGLFPDGSVGADNSNELAVFRVLTRATSDDLVTAYRFQLTSK